MKIIFATMLVGSLTFFISSVNSNAGLLSNLFGFEDFESCIAGKFNETKTSWEIKKLNDYCKKKYPKANDISISEINDIDIPTVDEPLVPSPIIPLIPTIPTPKK